MENAPRSFCHSSFRGRIGLARRDITPPVGIYARNWGAAPHDFAESIHRPLSVSAISISTRNDVRRMLLIDADLGWWKSPQTFTRFKERLLKELSLDSSEFLFALTHTHSGPPLMDADENLPRSELHRTWIEEVLERTVEAAKDAKQNEFDATLDWHTGRCGLATIRDLPDPDATRQRVICGYVPDSPADDTLLVGRITDEAGKIRGTVVNYACHPTTLAWENTSISPDYIGAMRETMEQVTNAPALFLLGMCGDLAPRYQYVGDPTVADSHGRQLGHAALAVLHDMEPAGTQLAYHGVVESGAPLAVWKREPHPPSEVLCAAEVVAEIPLKNWPSADELESQRRECMDRALEERLRRKRDIRRYLGAGASFPLSIHTWRLGAAVLVGSCCEPYSELQTQLRRRFPERALICMNLINGSLGYLPPSSLYDQDVYQVWQTPFDRGSYELTKKAMIAAIERVL